MSDGELSRTEFLAKAERVLGESHERDEAFGLFFDGVGAVMLRLVEADHPAGLVLLELVRDLEARLGEFTNGEESNA